MGETMKVSVPGEQRPFGGFGHAGVVAIRKAKIPGWTPFRYDRIGDDVMFTGGIEGKYKNGKRKWPKPHSKVVVTQAEMRDEADRYEHEHGRCRNCFGRGEEWVGWSVGDGNRYSPCVACNSTGRPAASVVTA